ncbi:CHASE2 domain-containing protein [Ichthyenterobacterium sp. W332]|uniref:CHASE2 domain-containing protein n=1 Tax=Microcosmobacter mediterraneus TaxID=3075607 RepID=A0ABU2YHD0_9FLAO|nr:CHASE2 domain-containing protein [Ichthyenterobacterium sp. W332]MDT0557570.1 CHASE2 domain-containing protein [Ichthyenterobacterium sp. W332]
MKKKTKLLIRDAFLSTLLTSVILLILSLAFFNIRWFNPLHKAFKDFSFLDIFYSEGFYNDQSIVINDIILVNVEDKSRTEIAEVLQQILKADPSAVGFDIILKDLKDDFETDAKLSDLLKHEKVITSCKTYNGKIEYSHPFFKGKTSNHGNTTFNSDTTQTSVKREFEGITEINGEKLMAFSALLAKKHLGKKWKKYKLKERLKQTQYITYYGHYDDFLHLDFKDFNVYEKKDILKDKIVIMGYLGTPTGNVYDIEDKHFTPLNKYSAGKTDKDMYGVTIHANITNSLITNDLIFRVSNFWTYIITFLSIFFTTMYYMKLSKTYKVSYRTRKQLFQLIFAITLFSVSLFLFRYKIVFPFAIIIIGVILAGGYFKYYKHLTRYINTKRKWKTYLK